MDQMLPSPGFSIPSIGTPLHQPEEDQLILPMAQQQQQQQAQQPPPLMSTMPMQAASTTPQRLHTFANSFPPPQSLMQPQTPVRYSSICLSVLA
jgi:transcription initiation factor TFIID TATA-box-binding protein